VASIDSTIEYVTATLRNIPREMPPGQRDIVPMVQLVMAVVLRRLADDIEQQIVVKVDDATVQRAGPGAIEKLRKQFGG
jgi:hypothetical protein